MGKTQGRNKNNNQKYKINLASFHFSLFSTSLWSGMAAPQPVYSFIYFKIHKSNSQAFLKTYWITLSGQFLLKQQLSGYSDRSLEADELESTSFMVSF